MKKLHLVALAAATLFATSLALHAAPPPPVSALRVEKAPTLDGKLDDPVWKEAKWQEGFTELGTGKPAETPTRFAVAYDDRHLHIAIRASEPNLDKLKAKVTNRARSLLELRREGGDIAGRRGVDCRNDGALGGHGDWQAVSG